MPELTAGRIRALASISIDSIVVCSCKQCQQHLPATKIELINNGSGGLEVRSASGNINPWQANTISASGSVTARLFEVWEPGLVFNLRMRFGNATNIIIILFCYYYHYLFPLAQSFFKNKWLCNSPKDKQTSQMFSLCAIQDRMCQKVLSVRNVSEISGLVETRSNETDTKGTYRPNPVQSCLFL